MRKLLCVVLIALVLAFAGAALAEAVSGESTEPFTWEYLATIAGASTFTLLVVQFIKGPLDKLVKIPTRIVAYAISAAVMLVALAFTDGFTWGGVCLALANAFISALAASGTYDTITAKRNESETEGQEE